MTDASDRQLLKAVGRRLLDRDEATPTPGIWAAMVGPSGITVWQRDALLAAAQRIERALNICTRCPWCAITADGPTDELRDAIESATP